MCRRLMGVSDDGDGGGFAGGFVGAGAASAEMGERGSGFVPVKADPAARPADGPLEAVAWGGGFGAAAGVLGFGAGAGGGSGLVPVEAVPALPPADGPFDEPEYGVSGAVGGRERVELVVPVVDEGFGVAGAAVEDVWDAGLVPAREQVGVRPADGPEDGGGFWDAR